MIIIIIVIVVGLSQFCIFWNIQDISIRSITKNHFSLFTRHEIKDTFVVNLNVTAIQRDHVAGVGAEQIDEGFGGARNQAGIALRAHHAMCLAGPSLTVCHHCYILATECSVHEGFEGAVESGVGDGGGVDAVEGEAGLGASGAV